MAICTTCKSLKQTGVERVRNMGRWAQVESQGNMKQLVTDSKLQTNLLHRELRLENLVERCDG